MIDYDKQFNDIIAQIQAQYRGSNVAELIKGIIEIKKKGVLRAYQSLIDDCLNLSTAKGDALDLWGYILGVNRYVARDATEADGKYNWWSFNDKNFKELIFLQVRDHLYHRLDDDAFRNLLLLFLQRQYIFPSLADAQNLIDDYLSDKYGEISIFDTQKMGMEVEFSYKDYPVWMRWYILLKDIIPRPAGVKVNGTNVEPTPPEPEPPTPPEPEPETEGLRFTAQEANSSVTLHKIGSPNNGLWLEYRTDTNPDWQNYTLGTAINLANVGNWVEMRNRGLQTLNNTASDYHQFVMTGKIAASGNIQYLLDKTGELLSVSAYCYYNMFRQCDSLTIAPSLPATTLADSCYHSMFSWCDNLTTAPKLPATTLANNCYGSMFYGSGLTTAPEILATTLADSCCDSMFRQCYNLTTAPKLLATTLADYCYHSMFRNCTSLTTAPEILATTFANECCANMFEKCTSLTTAPEILATTVADYCCDYMFYDCRNLTTAPSILPATTLANNCYAGMFYNCPNLTTAPKILATTLADMCCIIMFDDCTSLKVNQNGTGNKIFTCPSTSGLDSPVDNMFAGTGTFTGTPTAGNTYNWY